MEILDKHPQEGEEKILGVVFISGRPSLSHTHCVCIGLSALSLLSLLSVSSCFSPHNLMVV